MTRACPTFRHMTIFCPFGTFFVSDPQVFGASERLFQGLFSELRASGSPVPSIRFSPPNCTGAILSSAFSSAGLGDSAMSLSAWRENRAFSCDVVPRISNLLQDLQVVEELPQGGHCPQIRLSRQCARGHGPHLGSENLSLCWSFRPGLAAKMTGATSHHALIALSITNKFVLKCNRVTAGACPGKAIHTTNRTDPNKQPKPPRNTTTTKTLAIVLHVFPVSFLFFFRPFDAHTHSFLSFISIIPLMNFTSFYVFYLILCSFSILFWPSSGGLLSIFMESLSLRPTSEPTIATVEAFPRWQNYDIPLHCSPLQM